MFTVDCRVRLLILKKLLKILILSTSLLVLTPSKNFQKADAYNLSSFNSIKGIEISPEEKKADIINFNEFLRIYYYNYISKKSEKEKNRKLVSINSDIAKLKYSNETGSERKPPVILHWTDANNAMGVIKTLFTERYGMKEGIIGVDYVVSEPLLHPDYPNRPARSYSIKFSKSEVATTWFHVPDNVKKDLKNQDRKYNKAINIEIVGWRFFPNNKGKKDDFGRSGKKGIREKFDGKYDTFDTFDSGYTTYPTVLKLMDNLAEKYDFGTTVDNFSPENEISPELKQKNIIYLNGPVSKSIKGHGLIALEHTLTFGSNYINERHDFTPNELLTFYQDLKDFRRYQKDLELVKKVEERVNINEKLSELDYQKTKDLIDNIKSKNKKEYLLLAMDFNSVKVPTLDKLNAQISEIQALKGKEKEKLTSMLITKFLNDADKVQDSEYESIKTIILTFKDTQVKEKTSQQLYDRYAYNNKKKNS